MKTNYKKMAKLMTKAVNHPDFPKLLGFVDNWVKEAEAKLSPEQKEKLYKMISKKAVV